MPNEQDDLEMFLYMQSCISKVNAEWPGVVVKFLPPIYVKSLPGSRRPMVIQLLPDCVIQYDCRARAPVIHRSWI